MSTKENEPLDVDTSALASAYLALHDAHMRTGWGDARSAILHERTENAMRQIYAVLSVLTVCEHRGATAAIAMIKEKLEGESA